MIEVLVATSIITVSILVAMAVAEKSVYVSRQAFHTSQAAFLLEEGAETVRIFRDNGWSNISGLTVSTNYYPAFSGNTGVLSTTSNPIAYWNFNETSGTTATDTSDFLPSHPATLINDPIWSTGIDGNSLLFNGSNTYASTSTSPIPTLSKFSISAWVNMSVNQSGWGSIVIKRDTYGLEVLNGFIYANIGNGTSSWINTVSAPLSAGVWHHVVQTYDGATNRLYVDGGAPVSGTGTLIDTANNLLIGSWNTTSEFFNGKIDEVRIYDRALTATEVTALHDSIVIAPDTISNAIGIFKRKVTIANVNRDNTTKDIVNSGGTPDSGTKLITVTVSWPEGGVIVTKTLQFYISDIFS